MADINSWHEDLAALLDENSATPFAVYARDFSTNRRHLYETSKLSFSRPVDKDAGESRVEGYGQQAREFARAWCEMVWELGKPLGDVMRQSLVTDNSFMVKKTEVVFGRLRLLNDYLSKDKDPAHPWTVVLLVFVLALLALCVDKSDDCINPSEKEVQVHPPSALWIMLPDARHLAYEEQGVRADKARFTVIIPHAFLFSRMAALCVDKSDDCINPSEKEVQVHPSSALRIMLPDARHLAYEEQGVRADKARFTVIIPHAFLFSRMARKSKNETIVAGGVWCAFNLL